MTAYVGRPLEGRSVAVTGAGRGIGAATARLLAELGASIALAARSESELVEVAQSISDAGGRATYLVTDVTKPGDLEELVQLAIEQFGSLDALINNAGIAFNSPLAAVDLADWNAMIDVNLRGVLHGIAAALPHFVSQRSGHIVTVASVAAYKWAPGQGVYAATKAAVRALGEVLRQEAAQFNVRSTLVSPGFTHTEFVSTSSRDTAQLASLQARRDALAMPPAAVAEAIAYALTQPDDIDVGEIIVRPTAHP
jgi:NADP-dependent 3-hydroxy acid dehydrogenase YdfG